MERNVMLEQTLSYPALFTQVLAPLQKQVETVLTQGKIDMIDSIYLYGSGDSLNAANCVAQAFADYAKLPAHPIGAMQASRYLAPSITESRASRTLCICISSSGEAARSAEAAMALKRAKCRTMAVTANPDSRVGRAVDHILLASVPPFPAAPFPVPGVRSFAPPVIALLLLAVHLGVCRGVLTQADAARIRAELAAQAEILRDAFERGGETLRNFAMRCAASERMEFLAAGPCRGAADFGVSKVLEAQGYGVLSQDIEEFAHQTFFSLDTDRLPTVLLLPSQGRCAGRAWEILFVLHRLQRPVLVLADDAPSLDAYPDITAVCLKRPVSEDIVPLVFACLMCYLASVMPLREGDRYMHGHLGIYAEDDLPTVRGSRLELVE